MPRSRLFWPLWMVSFLALVRVLGANVITDENALAGSPSWVLTNPATFREIEGYASLTSVNKGGQISLFVSTVAATYTIDVYRMGWYGGAGARQVLGPIQQTGIHQVIPTPDPVTGLAECDWQDAYVLNG